MKNYLRNTGPYCKLFLLSIWIINTNPAKAQSMFSQQSMQNASNYSSNKGGSSVLIMQNGNIVFEEYHNSADSSIATHLHSATKFFWAAAAALAKQQGLISSYDELVSNTITEWQNTSVHPGKNLIKIKHLLQLSSGLSQDLDQIQGDDSTVFNIYQHVVDSLDLNTIPGTHFQYGPSHYYAFGVLLERKLHNANRMINPLQYLQSDLFNPIGFQYQTWVHDSAGNPHIPNGCYVTPRNWAKYGRFMLQKGLWGTSQIINNNLVSNMYVATGPNPGHGYFCWRNNVGGWGAAPSMSAPPGSPGGFIYYNGFTEIIGGLGAGKNRMYLIPSLNAVVIRQTLMEDDTFNDHIFLSSLLNVLLSSDPTVIQENDMLSVYPNPTSGNVRINISNEKIKVIKLLNLQGQLMREYFTNDFSIADLPNAVYFITTQTDKSTFTIKLIKQSLLP